METYEVSWGSKKKAYKTALGAYKKFKILIETEEIAAICSYENNVIVEVLEYSKYLLQKFSYKIRHEIKDEIKDGDRILEGYYFKLVYETFPIIEKLTNNILSNLTKRGIIVSSREIKREIIRYFRLGYEGYRSVYVLVTDAIYINIDGDYTAKFEYKNKDTIVKSCAFTINSEV